MFSLFKKKQPQEGLQEFSANFDSQWVRPFLERILVFFESGFGASQVNEVCQVIDSLPHDQEKTIEFKIRSAEKDATFRIHIFMDDIDSPDIAFFAPAALTQQIGTEYRRFTEEKGA